MTGELMCGDFAGTVPDRFLGGGPEIVEQEKPYTRFPTVVEGKVEPDGKLHLTVHDILHGVVAFNTVI